MSALSLVNPKGGVDEDNCFCVLEVLKFQQLGRFKALIPLVFPSIRAQRDKLDQPVAEKKSSDKAERAMTGGRSK